MSKWRVVDLHRYSGVVAAKEGRLFVGESSVALSDISVMLLGPRCQVHASVFDRAAEYSFPILACDWRHVPRSVMLPWSENSRVGARHVAQAELSAGRTKNAWMQIVKAKIAGQAHNLGETPAGRRLKEIAQSVRSGDPANCEAQAAGVYWRHSFPDDPEFKRAPLTGVGRNALLNYGYTVIRGHVVRSIVEAGLWPTLGIRHRGRSNTFALADDLIEPFRPAVDGVVRSLPAGSQVKDPEVKRALVEVSDLPFCSDGFSIQTHIQRLAQNFALYVEDDLDKLPVRHWGQRVRRDG